jgi:hypothetical protein
MPRIPFDIAVSEPGLLGPHWNTLSFPQQAVLLAAYGCPLDGTERDERGWTRLDYFWASQGHGQFDELGYLTAVHHPGPYVPKSYSEVWAVDGVRSGKSDQISATANVYEALCGGHEDRIRPGKQGYILLVAQNLRMARAAIHSITATLRTIPMLADEPWNRIENPWVLDGKRWSHTTDRVDLWNGMCVLATPPTVKAIRGFDSPSAVLDEVGVWPTESDKANVDEEIYDQVISRQAQFIGGKTFAVSSPWIMAGMLYRRFQVGTEGCKVFCPACDRKEPDDRDPSCSTCREARKGYQGMLVFHMPTAAMNNPMVTKEWLQSKRDKNPQKFDRECMARFQPASDGFLDPTRVEAAVDRGTRERKVVKPSAKEPLAPFYVAAMDPAFKQDDFAFAIGHMDGEDRVVIDLIRTWTPPPGGSLKPEGILDELTPLIRTYGINHVLSDQYHFQSLASLAQDRHWFIEPLAFTGTSKNNLYGNLQNLLYQDRLRLPDHPEAVNQLKSLQRIYGQQGRVAISAPPGMHDDMATVIALVASRAVYMQPEGVPETPVPKTLAEQCWDSAMRKQTLREQELDL